MSKVEGYKKITTLDLIDLTANHHHVAHEDVWYESLNGDSMCLFEDEVGIVVEGVKCDAGYKYSNVNGSSTIPFWAVKKVEETE